MEIRRDSHILVRFLSKTKNRKKIQKFKFSLIPTNFPSVIIVIELRKCSERLTKINLLFISFNYHFRPCHCNPPNFSHFLMVLCRQVTGTALNRQQTKRHIILYFMKRDFLLRTLPVLSLITFLITSQSYQCPVSNMEIVCGERRVAEKRDRGRCHSVPYGIMFETVKVWELAGIGKSTIFWRPIFQEKNLKNLQDCLIFIIFPVKYKQLEL